MRVVANGAAVPYPPGTANLHHEIELVVALRSRRRATSTPQRRAGPRVRLCRGQRPHAPRPAERRPRARAALGHGQGLRSSAPLAALRPASSTATWTAGASGSRSTACCARSRTSSHMLWDVPHIIAALSRLYELRAGDLIFTGTPAGVGALKVGDRDRGRHRGAGGAAAHDRRGRRRTERMKLYALFPQLRLLPRAHRAELQGPRLRVHRGRPARRRERAAHARSSSR